MIEVGKLVTVTLWGCNYGFPDEYLRGMGLSHLKANHNESVREGVLYVVIGRTEYYPTTKLGIMSVRTNDLFVVDEDDVKIIHTEVSVKRTTQDEVIEALQMSIETEINLMFEDEFSIGNELYDFDSDFDYEEWYKNAREIAYNLEHIMTLRNFIEGN